MNRTRCGMLPLAFVIGITGLRAYAGRDIPENNLAYPVSITTSSGSASGFYGSAGNFVYLITACHVLYSDQGETLKSSQAELLSYPADPRPHGTFVVTVDLAGLQAQSKIRTHDTHDVSMVCLGQLNREKQIVFLPGVAWKQKVGDEPLLITDLRTASKKFADVFEANEAFIFGYPTSLGLGQVAQIDPERPLLRKGIVAGRNPRNKTLVVDCPVYFGNSGGPVVEVNHVDATNSRILLIGIVSQFVPFKEEILNRTYGTSSILVSNSGYAIITPMDAVLELLGKD